MSLESLVGAIGVALVFLLVDRLTALEGERSAPWLSASAGVAIAYVFVDVMPHLASKQEILLAATDEGVYGFLTNHAYLVAMLGFTTYLVSMLGIDRAGEGDERLPPAWLIPAVHIYNGLGTTGYLMLIGTMLAEQPSHRYEPGALFAIAMTIHLIGIARFLHDQLGSEYNRVYRYVFAGAILMGWGLGAAVTLSETTYALWFSFLAGGIIGFTVTTEIRVITTMKSLGFFILGSALLASLILLLEFTAGLAPTR